MVKKRKKEKHCTESGYLELLSFWLNSSEPFYMALHQSYLSCHRINTAFITGSKVSIEA